MRNRIRHQREPPENDENAQDTIGEPDQNRRKKRAQHILSIEQMAPAVGHHLCAPEKVCVPNVRATVSSVNTCSVGPYATSSPFNKITSSNSSGTVLRS